MVFGGACVRFIIAAAGPHRVFGLTTLCAGAENDPGLCCYTGIVALVYFPTSVIDRLLRLIRHDYWSGSSSGVSRLPLPCVGDKLLLPRLARQSYGNAEASARLQPPSLFGRRPRSNLLVLQRERDDGLSSLFLL